jgi:hypothetical protein
MLKVLMAGNWSTYGGSPCESMSALDIEVLDGNGQALVYVYASDTANEANIAGVLTFDEARRIALNVAKFPELRGQRSSDGQRTVSANAGEAIRTGDLTSGWSSGIWVLMFQHCSCFAVRKIWEWISQTRL